ncbi:hypothetical protein Moror_12472 [Moniliophthora roreri MCA 2997]|uniref:Uncharacterized protein n=1 Tax=Moniliophthora roreri (strain MCA 2997) TaxID=1381753 RepID=V2X994_MONRO|nr:hypothetical protein Moror_12472 [Moniliophthora roreri MCA 2997]
MEVPTSPAQIADSIAAIIQRALTDTETRCKADVARADADALQARNERDQARLDRDNAVKLLHEAQLKAQEWKTEVGVLKAELRQFETTVAHQTEAISLLKRELAQWKDQARNWQDHFLRVEEERCALSSKVEEYTERIHARPTLNMPPLTPTSRYADSDEATKPSSSGKYTEYSSRSESPDDIVRQSRAGPSRRKRPIPKSNCSVTTVKQNPHSEPADENRLARRRSQQKTPSHLMKIDAPAPSIVHSRLIRRVQAVVPVKQESDDDESPPPAQSSAQSRQTPRKRSSAAHELFDNDEDIEEDDDEDDELMISSQNQVDDSHPPPVASKRTIPSTAHAPPNKRRKSNASSSKSAGRKKG